MTAHEIRHAGNLWLQGRNTVEIAETLRLSEAKICRNIVRIRQEARLIAARAA